MSFVAAFFSNYGVGKISKKIMTLVGNYVSGIVSKCECVTIVGVFEKRQIVSDHRGADDSRYCNDGSCDVFHGL
jgi:hypothetical protein